MRNIKRIVFSFILICALLIPDLNVSAADASIVDVSQQLYTYDAMVEDMMLLQVGHEDIMTYEPLANTSQGRNVWLIKFGNLEADKKILITASIHAREYMTSQLVMKMLEEYVCNYDIPMADGTTYRQYFDSACFYILPMINPDGVSISQFGIDGATQETTRDWLRSINSRSGLTQIKANANGVDLNRNFPLGFGQDSGTSWAPGLCKYPGVAPFSEAETQVMGVLLNENDFVTCINYHSMGNVIYYGAATNSPEVAAGCQNMANIVQSITGYRKEYCGKAIGSFADYFGTVEAAPSVTIEIGTANPVPINQFPNIYSRNINVWPVIAGYYSK